MQIIQIIIQIIFLTACSPLFIRLSAKTTIEIIILRLPVAHALLVCVLAPAKLAFSNIRIAAIINKKNYLYILRAL